MQNAKDSFYAAMRARLGALNPGRTMLLRGMVRPGIVMEEAEAPFSDLPADAFVLRWSGTDVDMNLPVAMITAECEFMYQTCGSSAMNGLDRGRALSAMDQELLAMLQPWVTPKINYTLQPPQSMMSAVFWDEPIFEPITPEHDRLSRSAKVRVYSYQEQGE